MEPNIKNCTTAKTILFVDDDPVLREITPMLLRDLGHQVLCATDGYQAIEKFRQEKGAIDLVILDLVMPGLSGEETLERLRALDGQVKVVISSGVVQEKEAAGLIAQGCLAFLSKPYDIPKLQSILSRVFP